MYITQLHFEEMLEWFHNSPYEFLMLFLPSDDPIERKLDDYIIENQFRIDRLTGQRITYLSYVKNGIQKSPKNLSGNTVSINERRLTKRYIGSHINISDEVCDKLNIEQYKLPALILISRDNTYNLYPISTEADFDSYFTPISIVTSFLKDYNRIVEVERNISNLLQDNHTLDGEKNIIISKYAERLNKTIFSTNGEDILHTILHHYSSGLIKILNEVKEKANRINVIIESLNRRVEEEEFDVFISSKSEDYKNAFEVYNFLYENGYKPFLADPVLRQIGTDYYGYLIRRIIDKSRFMIVYASKVDYMNTSYVSAEWNQFLDLLSSGIKYGKLFSIIPPSTSAQELPAGLNVRQFFTTNNYKHSLLQYLNHDDLSLNIRNNNILFDNELS